LVPGASNFQDENGPAAAATGGQEKEERSHADARRILVLDHGKVVEFGTPWELIRANGAFRELVRQSGEENTLIEVSRDWGAGREGCLIENQS
jgi:ABC-type multidrug transport system ATPase subunit